MLECAFGQGDGNAAMQLYYIYQEQKRPDAKDRALRVLHEGVKLGGAECADYLQIDFGDPFKNVESLAPFIDKDRAERYGLIGDALSFNPKRRYPNLDRILPLPPAKLPPWDGKKQTLLDMAAGVSLTPPVPAPSEAANRQGRYHLDAHLTLCATGTVTTELSAPQPGFWQLLEQSQPSPNDAIAHPRFYDLGEPFCSATRVGADACKEVNGPAWTRFDTAHHNHAEVAPRAANGITRLIASSAPLQGCASDLPCPFTGIWQPWIDASHPMSEIVNQPWRQAWLIEAQAFPRPEHDWLLALPAHAVRWHLMEQPTEPAG